MKAVGIICEYNPFHNGHIYHIQKIKKLYPNYLIILVMSGNFLQRGDVSLINKWNKTKIALKYGINLVIELPFHFATQSADIFAHGAIKILTELQVEKIVFGSECNNIELLNKMADIQIHNDEYQLIVKNYLEQGINYPTALSKALKDICGQTIKDPNDLLGLSYVKEIKKQNSNIEAITIKRTNKYHSKKLNKKITSATSIREAMKNHIDITTFVPDISLKYINDKSDIESFFNFIKYKIISEINNLDKYQTVDEGIENRIKKYIYNCINVEDLINKIKTKRYTYNKIKRMLIHILCGFTKEEAIQYQNIIYIRILGFSDNGKKYINNVKKDVDIPIIGNFSKLKNEMLKLELKVTGIYASVLDEDEKSKLIKREYQHHP